MYTREDVEFPADDGVLLRGWLFVPRKNKAPYPAISMAHGYAGTREHGIEAFAQLFASNGFVVLLHDHRNFGESEGQPRHDIDPWRQISDWRRALTFLEAQQVVDKSRLGLWGTSYAGGHVIVLGATDRRVRAVVSQVPTISGYEQGLRRIPPEAVALLESALSDDEREQFLGKPPRYQTIVSADASVAASYRSNDAIDFYLQPLSTTTWSNEVTVRSTRAARMYEPGHWVPRVSPTPLLMVVAMNDTITVTDLALQAYEKALQPKKLVTVPGGHFDPYLGQFEAASSTALRWFTLHLKGGKDSS